MIIVFGSLNIDIITPVDNFPVQGETVVCSSDYISRPGGKGANQAVAAARAGAKVAIVGKIGDDSFGRRSIKNLKRHGILTAGIGISDRPTGCATIAVNAKGKSFVVSSSGANREASEEQLPAEILGEKNILLTELELNVDDTLSVLKRARENGATNILNASPSKSASLEILKNVDYMIVNEVEALQIATKFKIDKTNPLDLVQEFSKMADLTCIITLEEKGAIACRNSVIYQIPPLDITAVDSTGAGDCFCGVFAACLEKGFDWLKATHYASAGAGLSCLGLSAQQAMPDFETIESKIHETPAPKEMVV